MIRVGFLILLYTAAISTASGYKPCVHTFKPVKNFNATKFEGLWYEVRQIFPTPGREGTCGSAMYTADDDGTLEVVLSWMDTDNESQQQSGTIINDGDPTDGELTFKFGKKSDDYTIFYLKYNSIFAVYSCVRNKADVWVFARTQNVGEKMLAPIKRAMKKNGLNPKSLSVVDQSDCSATGYNRK